MKKLSAIILALACFFQVKAAFAQIDEQNFNVNGSVSINLTKILLQESIFWAPMML